MKRALIGFWMLCSLLLVSCGNNCPYGYNSYNSYDPSCSAYGYGNTGYGTGYNTGGYNTGYYPQNGTQYYPGSSYYPQGNYYPPQGYSGGYPVGGYPYAGGTTYPCPNGSPYCYRAQ